MKLLARFRFGLGILAVTGVLGFAMISIDRSKVESIKITSRTTTVVLKN